MTSDSSNVPTPDEGWVTEQLQSLPPPVMPAHIASRISAALREEQRTQAGGAGSAGQEAAAGENVADSNRRRGLFTGLAVAASAALALMLVSWNPWQSSPDDYERVMALNSVQPVSTDTNYTSANIVQAVGAHLDNVTARTSDLPVATDAERRGSFAANDDVMASCLDGLGTALDDVRLVDLADYQGQPSGIVVYADEGGNLVVVVGPRCGRDDPGVRMRLSTRGGNTQP